MKEDETGTVGWVVHGSQRAKRRPSLIRYLVLYVMIVCGVAGGILLANWITGSGAQAPGGSFAQKAGHVASAVGSELHAVYREAVAKVKGDEGTGDRESREASATGRDLRQQCENWRQAYAAAQTQAAHTEMDRNCRRYEKFLATGDSEP